MGEQPKAGRYSVAFPKMAWYPACPAPKLGPRKPIGISLMDTPIVVFRDADGRPRALVDRCPHRNAPLSLGRVHPDGNLECGYHGWRFDGATGECAAIPGLIDESPAATTRQTVHHAATEQDGFVWIWGEPGAEPPADQRPFALPPLEEDMAEVVFSYDLECTMHAAIENALDVPHTAFLHRGIFRGSEKSNTKAITAERHDLPGGVEVQYLGEPVGMGPIQLGESTGLTFDHWDRFFLPSIAQVEYRVEGWLRITNSILHLPMSDFRTRAWFVVRFWTKAPPALVKPIVLARGRQILRQDARMLKAQTDTARHFGGERHTSTNLDLLGNAIWRLLRHAEKGEIVDIDLPPRHVEFQV